MLTMSRITNLPRINRLPPALANQIAAGEVVERPASVVKELMENSLDAGATRVDVHVGHGGLEIIRITDDGCGVHPDDLVLALERHATSKLRRREDLEAIISLGFRGEALPSIASVSDFQLTSMATGEAHAFTVGSPAGQGSPRPAAHPPGTTVEVKGLFQNFPARRKFLRSERTEMLHIQDVVQRVIMSRAGVGIRLFQDGQLTLSAPHSADLAARISVVLGKSFLAHAVALDVAGRGMKLSGWLGAAGLSRSQSDRQYLFLNGRPIRDRLVNHAARLAYGDAVPVGRYPVYVIYLEMDPADFDVNVHPTKHEVRFRNARDVHDFIHAGVRAALARNPDTGLPLQGSGDGDPGGGDVSGATRKGRPGQGLRDYLEKLSSGVADQPAPRLGRVIAGLDGEFIFTERHGAWLLVNLAALRARHLAVRLRAALAQGDLARRPLLVPVEMRVPASMVEAMENAAQALSRFGVLLAPVAPERFAIRALPIQLPDADAVPLVQSLVELLGKPGAQEAEDAVIDVMVRHAGDGTPGAVWGLEALEEEMRNLERGLDLDWGAEACAGIWRTVTRARLQQLLDRHGD